VTDSGVPWRVGFCHRGWMRPHASRRFGAITGLGRDHASVVSRPGPSSSRFEPLLLHEAREAQAEAQPASGCAGLLQQRLEAGFSGLRPLFTVAARSGLLHQLSGGFACRPGICRRCRHLSLSLSLSLNHPAGSHGAPRYGGRGWEFGFGQSPTVTTCENLGRASSRLGICGLLLPSMSC
jgi:hypothetical protein